MGNATNRKHIKMKPHTPKAKMNKTELRYAGQLEALKRAGQIIDYKFESMRLEVGEGAWYKPDFLVVFKDRFELHEIKGGFIRIPAMVRFKAAMMIYPWFGWRMMQWKNNQWKCIKEN